MSALEINRRTFLGGAATGVALTMLAGVPAFAGETPRFPVKFRLETSADWARFLGTADLLWGRIPRSFYEGPYLGNGGLGAAVYGVGKRLSFTIGDSRVRDHQETGGSLFGNARLRIGRLDIVTAGELIDVDLRISVYDAELSGTIKTTRGTIALRAFTHATRDLLVIVTDPSDGETASLSFTPYKAESPRLGFNPRPDGLRDNPAPVLGDDRCEQDLVAGGRTTTMWRTAGSTTLLTVAHSFPAADASQTAEATLNEAPALDVLTSEHREWWNSFYRKSFVSVPDGRLHSFYWIQLYKLASATRAGRPPVGTCAQWLEPTPWPGTWWNLNVQLEYWLINASGHPELDSLSSSLREHQSNLILNVPEKYRHDSAGLARTSQEDLRTDQLAEAGDTAAAASQLELGNLTWALHNAWLSYRHSMDDEVLRNLIFPVLRRAINYYLHFLQEGADGRLHLPRTYSPEYDFATDTNYDLALLTWGCRTLLDSAKRLGIPDELAPRWRDVLDRLVAPPQDAGGLRIGANRALTSSHRHFSHLLWFYPLQILDLDDAGNRDLLERSVKRWVGFSGALQGYTFTGASSMSSLLGDGDRALDYLSTLLDKYVRPNTMYAETGPVIETPLAGAQSILDMLIASRGDRVRVFPAVPSSWPELAVHDLRTEGAFLVSAARTAGVTRFVRVKSLAGEPLHLVPTGLPQPWAVQRLKGPKSPVAFSVEGDGLRLTLAADDEVMIYTEGTRPDTAIGAAPLTPYAYGKPDIVHGATVPVPLDDVLNHDAITFQTSLTDGNMGSGYSYPAEEMPASGAWSAGDVDWLFPGYADGQKNNIVPSGQRVAVPEGSYARLNVLGSGVNGTSSTAVTLEYADGSTGSQTVRLTDWGRESENDDVPLVITTHRHHTSGDHGLVVRIYHQTVAVDPARRLVALRLGSSSNGHIFAISLEHPLR
ncbi:Tat pathway signal sequence domain protein [Microbacterium sp. NPDC057650]|uniref:glycosyl hydrolase family 95 catalytic domain-containing protein n=1 Tax=unclassified Microbacterium TaxID=2609290 RepID=UPI0036728174